MDCIFVLTTSDALKNGKCIAAVTSTALAVLTMVMRMCVRVCEIM